MRNLEYYASQDLDAIETNTKPKPRYNLEIDLNFITSYFILTKDKIERLLPFCLLPNTLAALYLGTNRAAQQLSLEEQLNISKLQRVKVCAKIKALRNTHM